MRSNTAPSNFSLDDLIELADIRIKAQIANEDVNFFYYPFYTAVFILDDIEELLVAFDAVEGKLIKEEDGIKINISGTQAKETEIPEAELITPILDREKIPKIISDRVKYKKVKHVKTDLVYFPCICAALNTRFGQVWGKKFLLFNTSSASFHVLNEKIVNLIKENIKNSDDEKSITAKENDSVSLSLQSIKNESTQRKIVLPSRSVSCFVDMAFVKWLINHKMEYRHKKVSINKMSLSYEPFYILKYYARRVRALKAYTYCSVNALKGSWSPHVHKVLEYDTLKTKGIIPQGEYKCQIEDVTVEISSAMDTAKKYIQKFDGVMNVRFSDSQIVYSPIWNIELGDFDSNQHIIEICGVTGYVVAEKTIKESIQN